MPTIYIEIGRSAEWIEFQEFLFKILKSRNNQQAEKNVVKTFAEIVKTPSVINTRLEIHREGGIYFEGNNAPNHLAGVPSFHEV